MNSKVVNRVMSGDCAGYARNWIPPTLVLFWGVFWIILLLSSSSFPTSQSCPPPLIQNVMVFLCKHDPLHLSWLPYSILAQTPPYHSVTTSSMLDSRNNSPVYKWYPLSLPDIHLFIWHNPIEFDFICPQYHFQSSTIQFLCSLVSLR